MYRERKADALHPAEGSSPGRAMAMCRGHHRGLRPGHAFMRVAWGLGRSKCFLGLEDGIRRSSVRRNPSVEVESPAPQRVPLMEYRKSLLRTLDRIAGPILLYPGNRIL